jgi:hypothetical protein
MKNISLLQYLSNYFKAREIRKKIKLILKNTSGAHGTIGGYELREYRNLQIEHTKLTGKRFGN